jgi:ABC-2 type transport system ATP-binding protein
VSSTAIDIQNVSKRFRLYHEKYSSLKERVLHAGHVPFEEFWALKGISAEIETGTTIGVLGRNGSGKSTLLKCMAGILQPTSGQVVVRGQLAAMLELGAGFQPELSGRDNIFLNGSLLGLSRREIARRFDAIVAFAELEQFIDNQVKYYSSGMYVRLGFAVAVNTDPDVLLVDEVLAVGDERFQQKCLDRVAEFQQDGKTIVVVSHSPDLMRQICEEILVIDRGELVAQAPPGEAIRIFRDRLIDAGFAPPPEPEPGEQAAERIVIAPHQRQITMGEVELDYPGVGERPYLSTGDPLKVTVGFDVVEPVLDTRFQFVLLNEKFEVMFAELREVTLAGGILERGHGSISFCFDSISLLDGTFSVNLDVRSGTGVVIDVKEPACSFEVMNPGRATGLVAMPLVIELNPPGGNAPRG